MRTILLLLVALAGFKIWYQDRIYRTSTETALMSAYAVRAAEACANEGKRSGFANGAPVKWSPERVVIGTNAVPVYLWDLENPLWDVRFKHPHIIMSSGSKQAVHCEFNVVAGLSRISRL